MIHQPIIQWFTKLNQSVSVCVRIVKDKIKVNYFIKILRMLLIFQLLIEINVNNRKICDYADIIDN